MIDIAHKPDCAQVLYPGSTGPDAYPPDPCTCCTEHTWIDGRRWDSTIICGRCGVPLVYERPDCVNCGDPYAMHNGYTLGSGVREKDRPPDWGGACGRLVDSHHTCPCHSWMVLVDGERFTQRMLGGYYQ